MAPRRGPRPAPYPRRGPCPVSLLPDTGRTPRPGPRRPHTPRRRRHRCKRQLPPPVRPSSPADQREEASCSRKQEPAACGNRSRVSAYDVLRHPAWREETKGTRPLDQPGLHRSRSTKPAAASEVLRQLRRPQLDQSASRDRTVLATRIESQPVNPPRLKVDDQQFVHAALGIEGRLVPGVVVRRDDLDHQRRRWRPHPV